MGTDAFAGALNLDDGNHIQAGWGEFVDGSLNVRPSIFGSSFGGHATA